MVGNINDFMNLVQQLKTNPAQMIARRFNIANDVNINNPNDIIQHLLNTGQISQSQVNQAMGMQNNPIIQHFLNRR